MNFACFVQFLLEKASLCLKGGGGSKKNKKSIAELGAFLPESDPSVLLSTGTWCTRSGKGIEF